MPAYNQLGTLASGILQYEFDFVTGGQERAIELLLISGTLSGLVGELNTLINTSYSFGGHDVSGTLYSEEQSILTQLYLRDNSLKQARKLLRGLYASSTAGSIVESADWSELRDGDTIIRRTDGRSANSATTRLNASKDFKALAKDAEERIKELVYKYNLYGAVPRQVAGNEGYYTSGTCVRG